jgi:hypothetical protein
VAESTDGEQERVLVIGLIPFVIQQVRQLQ